MNKRINLNPISLEDVYADCLSTVTNKKDEFDSYSSFVLKKQGEYLTLGNSESYENFKDFYLDDESHIQFKRSMIWLYDSKFSRIKNDGRKHYDKILSSARDNICPYCLHRETSQLDHFLPKTESPSLSVTPENLVPSCSECNFNKRNNKDLFVNPHFDSIDTEIYLHCRIIPEGDPFLFDFTLSKPFSWSDSLFTRLKNQMINAKYSSLYSAQAVRTIKAEMVSFKSLLDSYGKDELLKHLMNLLSGSEDTAGLNHWKSAYYRGWIKFLETTDSPFDFSERQI